MAEPKYYTIMFIPDGTEQRTGFKVRQWVFKLVLYFLIFLLVGIVLFFAFYTLSAGLAIKGIDINFWNTARSSEQAISQGNEQIVNMAVTYRGYNPSSIRLEKGVPVRWVIDGQQVTGCTNEIMVPELGIRQKIYQGENIIEFTPTKEGVINFSCWMGMVRGKFIVE